MAHTRNQLFEEIFVSTGLTGKMKDVQAVSTNPMSNPFCQKMHECGGICGECYAYTIMERGCRPQAIAAYEKNSRLLSENVLPADRLPRLNAIIVRFNSFGEIINRNHMINMVNICNFNPRTIFGLWTKRLDIVNDVLGTFGKPDNMVIVWSLSRINGQPPQELPHFVDRAFTILTDKDDPRINCGDQRCMECLACYDVSSPVRYVYERLKRR